MPYTDGRMWHTIEGDRLDHRVVNHVNQKFVQITSKLDNISTWNFIDPTQWLK